MGSENGCTDPVPPSGLEEGDRAAEHSNGQGPAHRPGSAPHPATNSTCRSSVVARRFTQAHLMLDPGCVPTSCSFKQKEWDSFLKRDQSTLEKRWMGEHCVCDAGL